MKFRSVAVLAIMLAAPISVAAKPNPLAADVRQTLFIKDVSVVWSVDDAKAAEKPEYTSFKQDFQQRVKDAVAQTFLNSPAGPEAAEMKLNVKSFNCAFTGCFAEAEVTIVRLSDGVELGTYQKIRGMQVASGGLLGVALQAAAKPDVVGITSASFAATLRAKFDAKK